MASELIGLQTSSERNVCTIAGRGLDGAAPKAATGVGVTPHDLAHPERAYALQHGRTSATIERWCPKCNERHMLQGGKITTLRTASLCSAVLA